jgi:hypothetical protein
MHRKPVFSKALYLLLIAGLLLPIAISVIVALAALLTAMQDTTGGAALRYVALAGGVLWVVDLVAIVLVQAMDSLDRPDEEDRS